MNKHGRSEISRCKHGGNGRKMRTDLVPAGRVLGIVGFRFDTAAIRIEPEMMRGFFMREAHHFIAMFDHALLAAVLGRGPILEVHRANGVCLRCRLFFCKQGRDAIGGDQDCR
jgi:hypothetical protein